MKYKDIYQAFHLSELVQKQLKGAITAGEEQQIDDWASASGSNRKFLNKIKEAKTETEIMQLLEQFDEEKAYETFLQSVQREKRRTFKLKYGWIISSAAAVLTIGFVIYLWLHRATDIRPSLPDTANVILPGGNKAVLILSNGNKIDLTAISGQRAINQNGTTITNSGNGAITYQVADTGLNAQEYNTLVIPVGGEYQATLSDGTKVWLNAGSSLRYPVRFTGAARKVELTGEAYFEVAHNPKMPFHVVSKNQDVEVLGTSFNINAYAGDEQKTALVKGSIRISGGGDTRLLVPGEVATVKGAKISILKADLDAETGWKTGMFIFHNSTLRDIMKQLARWYDIEVDVNTIPAEEIFYGEIKRDAPLSAVLDMISSTSTLKFKMEGRRLILMQ
ncbi:FecR family protein [Pedobacter panaciterrae]|uniref:FecR family protein n=1 Tax=Pedobacter panaciterrae TaxID=363849 RepID=UPI0025975819|nr:FecR family protein [uncultured Pedobacter sp.]